LFFGCCCCCCCCYVHFRFSWYLRSNSTSLCSPSAPHRMCSDSDWSVTVPSFYWISYSSKSFVHILRGANLFILDQNLRSILFQAVFLVDKKSHGNPHKHNCFVHLFGLWQCLWFSKLDLELVSLLIESGLEVDAQDKKSNTRYNKISQNNPKVLINWELRIDTASNKDTSLRSLIHRELFCSLHYAAFCGNIDACRVLIEKGANNHHIVMITIDCNVKFTSDIHITEIQIRIFSLSLSLLLS
jgi:hypothetical protein